MGAALPTGCVFCERASNYAIISSLQNIEDEERRLRKAEDPPIAIPGLWFTLRHTADSTAAVG